MILKEQRIKWSPFSDKHKQYIKNASKNALNVAEGAIRSGKTIDHCIIAAMYLETCEDKIHLASGSSQPNAKLNIGECNGFGLEYLFRGRCKWGKFKSNEALYVYTQTGEKIVIFAGGGKADSYKKILGNSYGLWIATEINEHYDSDYSRESFIKVAFGRQAAAHQPLTLWDLNPCTPKHPIYENYIDKWINNYPGGYQYQHFTIDDNLSLTEERREEIKGRYDEASVWYQRDILGRRVQAEGLIYRKFADNPNQFEIERSKLPQLIEILIGVDFGGNGSNHAFVCSGIDAEYNLYALKSESIPAAGTDVNDLINELINFVTICKNLYGVIDGIYCDAAEQTIINTIRNRLPEYSIYNSLKNEIIDRVRALIILIGSDRFRYVKGENDALIEGISQAMWDSKSADKDERLDDGSTDIDILDAFEYSFEKNIYYFGR